jgi:16S rRNA processing protein RimM
MPRQRPDRREPNDGATSAPAAPLAGAHGTHAEDDWLLVGLVVGAFGVHGELKVRPETDFPERFARTQTIYVGSAHTPMPVAGARVTPGEQVILRLTPITDATAAARLRSTPLYVPASEATALPPDRFYVHDLIGLRAERPDGTVLGTISTIYPGPANDAYAVREVGTGREVLVPAIKSVVVRIDLAAGVMVIDPLPGLFDERFETAE